MTTEPVKKQPKKLDVKVDNFRRVFPYIHKIGVGDYELREMEILGTEVVRDIAIHRDIFEIVVSRYKIALYKAEFAGELK